MKRGALLLTLFIAAFEAACSGGDSTTLPPPTGGFSNSSLKGQYAFIMNGQAPDGPIARIGTFVADGSGNITGGLEVVNTISNGLQLLSFSASAYQVKADGRGAINLTNLTGTLSFSITMTSVSQGFIAETDGITGTSGTFELQDSSAFNLNGVNGSFIFDNSGIDPGGNFDSIVGQISLNAGTVSGGVFDENSGAVLSGPQTITTGTYFLDATNGATAGLGQISFSGFVYDFIIVNSRKIHLIEVPGSSPPFLTTAGTANAQTAAPASPVGFTGSFAFLTSGVGTSSPDFKAGRFTADGSGGLTSVAQDEKLLGDLFQVPKGTVSAAKYTIDTNFPGSGRGTITYTDSSLGTFNFVFYMSSASQGVMQDNGKGIVGDGVIMAQEGAPFTNGSVAADYAFNWSGTSTNNTTAVTAEEDFVGHVTVTSATSNNVTGAMDFSELNSNQGAFHDSPLIGSLTINGDGTNSSGSRSIFVVEATNPNGGPSSIFKFTLYPVNANTMFVVSQDNDHSTGGVFTRQVTPP
jgi:hypothetical protein